MKVFNEDLKLRDFNAWSGAIHTKQVILKNEKEEDFNYLIDDLFPDGLSETELNDLLWFDDDFIFENLNINIE